MNEKVNKATYNVGFFDEAMALGESMPNQ